MIETIDRAAVLALATGARTLYERDLSIAACFMRRAAEVPSACAVRSENQTLTYAELDDRSTKLARLLRARGVRAADFVGVQIERSALLPVALLGILKAGAAFVPIDTSAAPDQRAHIIADTAMRCAVVAGSSSYASFPESCMLVDLDRDALSLSDGDLDERSLDLGVTPSTVASVMYTSGSTGRPKGVLVDHRAIVRLVRGTDFISIARDDVFLQFAPPAFDASTFEIWAPLLNGATLAIAPPGPLSLEDLGVAIGRFGVTTLWLTAPLFALMVETEIARFSGLRNLITGGDIVSADHAKRFVRAAPATRLIDGYGPTENTTFSCTYTVSPSADFGATVPIGRPIANSCAYLLDALMEPLPPGAVGELYVGGDGLSRGYLNLPELTAERFVPNPFASDGSFLYRTGDRARMRPSGTIEFLGRIDKQVKIRGYRIELDEIEVAIGAHPEVLHAAAIVEERDSDKLLHAFVVRVPGSTLDEATLRAFTSDALPSYMVPNRFAFRAALPQLSSGKVDRIALAREASDRSQLAAHRLRPNLGAGGATLETISGIWCRSLGIDAVARDVNFFDAGGDSLCLLRVHTALRNAFAVEIALTDLFRESTIRKQSALIDRLRA